MITPNYTELLQVGKWDDPIESAKDLANYCAVLLKGGHNPVHPGVDYLFENTHIHALAPGTHNAFPKHGSGCVLSAAIAANMALGYTLYESCIRAKHYIEPFLNSHSSLLGYHHL